MNVQMSMHVNMCASVCVFIWIFFQRQFARVPKIHTHRERKGNMLVYSTLPIGSSPKRWKA